MANSVCPNLASEVFVCFFFHKRLTCISQGTKKDCLRVVGRIKVSYETNLLSKTDYFLQFCFPSFDVSFFFLYYHCLVTRKHLLNFLQYI